MRVPPINILSDMPRNGHVGQTCWKILKHSCDLQLLCTLLAILSFIHPVTFIQKRKESGLKNGRNGLCKNKEEYYKRMASPTYYLYWMLTYKFFTNQKEGFGRIFRWSFPVSSTFQFYILTTFSFYLSLIIKSRCICQINPKTKLYL